MRNVNDPQAASKALVDHALARFSTDNLSCMLVRFDGKAAQHAVDNKNDQIGVDGDPIAKSGGLSEAEHLVLESKKKIDESGQGLERVPSELMNAQEEDAEPGPELNPEALEAARKDKKPEPPAGSGS